MRDLKNLRKDIIFFFSDIVLYTVRFLFGAVFAVGYLKNNISEMVVSSLIIFVICFYLRRKQICEDNVVMDHINTLYDNCIIKEKSRPVISVEHYD